jgi:hypothetical protein
MMLPAAGPDLDAATHRAIGHVVDGSAVPPYSTEWAAGGRLMGLLIDSGYLVCRTDEASPVFVINGTQRFDGATHLEAVCRAIVALRLGRSN